MFLAMMLAVVIAIAASVGIALYFVYSEGGINLHNRFFRGGPRQPHGIAGNLLRGEPTTANARGWFTTGIGVAAMVFFTLARHQFVWWPFNPVGLPIAVVGWPHKMWFSIFPAWLVIDGINGATGNSVFWI